MRFGAVGASGYAVNLAIFAPCVHALGLDYRIAAVVAFLVAVANNFWWNRHWTFDAPRRPRGLPGGALLRRSASSRSLSTCAPGALVDGRGLAEVPAQAIAIVAATPLNFLGNKLWSFRD